MVALGVMSIGGYFIISMFKTGSMGQKTLLAQDDARVLTDNMAGMLSDPWACSYTFGDGAPQPINGVSPPGGVLSPSVSADPVTGPVNGGATAVRNIYDRNKTVQFTATLPPFNPPYSKFGNGGLQLYSIIIGGTTPPNDPKTKIPRWAPTSANAGTAFVQVDWLQTGGKGNSNGPQHLLRYFLVNVTAMDSANKITACTAVGGGGGGGTNYWTLNSNNDIYNNNSSGAGRVGIGTTTPAAPLHVNGQTIVTVPHASGSSSFGGLANSSITFGALSFTKASASTSILVMFSSNWLFGNCDPTGPCDCTEEVLIDGASCSPVPASAYLKAFTNTYVSEAPGIFSFCSGLSAATHTLSIRAKASGSGYCMGGNWTLAVQEVN